MLYPQIESNSISDDTIHNNQKLVDVKEIVEFWDKNGFGFSNMNDIFTKLTSRCPKKEHRRAVSLVLAIINE